MPTFDSISVNMLQDSELETETIYGKTFLKHLTRIWNLRITYPSKEILLWDDDVSGAFRQPKLHPDVSALFSFNLINYLFIPVGQTFGSNTSPHNYEPFALTRAWLAMILPRENDELIEKHWNYIGKIKFRTSPKIGEVIFTKVKKIA